MKFVFAVLLLLFAMEPGHTWIVHNSQTYPTGEDSLTIPFHVLDSLGNPTTPDSVYITVAGPSGGFVYIDSMSVSDSRISRITVGGKPVHLFRCQVSHIDGAGIPGGYAVTITARIISLGLTTATLTGFQLVARELSDCLALIDDTVVVRGGIIDSNRTERGLSSGHGGTSVLLVAVDSSTGQVLPNVRVTVRNLDQSALLALGLTDITGSTTFNLDTDSCLAIAAAPGFRFSPFDTVAINGGEVDTLFGYRWYPEPPPDADLCRVWGYLYGIDGAPQSGAVIRAALADGVARLSGAIVAPGAVTTTTDSSGLFQIDLIPSSLLQAGNARYDISITRPDGVILRQRIIVPEQQTWQLTW